MGVLRLLARHRESADAPAPPDPTGDDAQRPGPISYVLWPPPDPSTLMLPTVRTCADIPWAMIEIDTWPDGEARFAAQAYLNARWRELRCCDRPVPFGCDAMPYPDVPSRIDWSA